MKQQEEILFELPKGVEIFNGTDRDMYEAIQRETAQALAIPSYLLKPINEKTSWAIL